MSYETAPEAAPETSEAGGVSFPRLSARTQRFALGRPRSIAVAADGSRVTFLRSRGGTDPVTCLWAIDVRPGEGAAAERLVVDPRAVLGGADEQLPPEERARRERVREAAGGVVAYGVDRLATVAAFALSGRLLAADLATGAVEELPAAGPAVDPRPDPSGRRIAYVTGGALHVAERGGGDRLLAGSDDADDPDVTWGLAEFIAAEEMGRLRGYWWAPDGSALLVARVDNSPVQRWHIADPANPAEPVQEVAYPAAGTPNAVVTLAVVGLDGHRIPVEWDGEAFPYLVTASWRADRPATILVQSRDQRRMRVLAVDPATGRTSLVREQSDPAWLEIVPGVPGWLADGRLVWTADLNGTRRLLIGDEAVTPAGLQVDEVLHIGDDHVLLTAADEPTERHVHLVRGDGGIERLTSEPGVHYAVEGGGVLVLMSASLERTGALVTVLSGGRDAQPVPIASYAEAPPFRPNVTLLAAGDRELRTAVLFPRDGRRSGGPLPMLMDPYGGPHSQRVLKAQGAFLSSQWFADQGFAVVVTDGRGTPGRGPEWERALAGDLATPVLEDQVAAVEAVAKRFAGEVDPDRVAIRGWSFGGYLAALAVLRRPDVFHAAVAGAPVTDWRLYDTHYTERYLGRPDDDPGAYDRSSLIGQAAALERPLMIIHGLADDNVVAANSLRLSSALLAAGRPHTVLPLSGVTHMTPQEVVAENLLVLQVRFLREALALPAGG
ncbi:MAG: prolyl oligopeptidase family serine peptidase [Frankiaceae bacterium]